MRYIGGKANLLEEIEALIKTKTNGNEKIFVDLFAGTGVVAQYFKKDYKVITNDMMHYSNAILRGSVMLNKHPQFKALKKIGITSPLKYLNDLPPSISGFITKNYSPSENSEGRMYVTVENAMRIDTIRIEIENWKNDKLLTESEYYYLLNSLIQAVPYISNITGTFGAYLKHWDKRTQKRLHLESPILNDNSLNNQSYNMDANILASKIKSDITYIDPPYNGRQYTSNYHLLETIARYDNPEIKGITGIRKYDSEEKSKYCSKRHISEQFDQLFKELKTKHIVVSYSSDGLLSKEDILSILRKHTISDSVECIEVDYRRYKSKIVKKRNVVEYLFYATKKTVEYNQKNKDIKKQKVTCTAVASNFQEDLLASPLNYIGGKYKLLPQILPFFPQKVDKFVDMFCGGLNVGVNVNANIVYANDLNDRVIGVLELIKKTPIEELLASIYEIITEYQLSSKNKDAFLKLRENYNNKPTPLMLYVLVCYSFNYQFRFNNSLKFNNPFGKDRSQFSEALKNKLIRFNKRIFNKNIILSSTCFTDFINNIELGTSDLVYCDPPYLITTGSYNDGNRGFKDWTKHEEITLYETLDRLDKKGVKFALSNVIEHKGIKNEILTKWATKYYINHLNYDYKNSSYNTSRGGSSEVIITNYSI